MRCERLARSLGPLQLAGPALVALAGLAQLGLLGYIFANRLSYPLDLEWMEGGMLVHALRLMQGQPLYGPPSAEFISYLYTPLYPALLALGGKLLGLSYALGRALSVSAFAAALALAYLVVQRQSGGRLAGHLWALGALGLIAASFPHAGAWYDLVRNDALYLALTTAGLVLLFYRHQHWGSLIAAGVLLGLAFLTKQTASLFIIYSGLALLLLDWRRLPLHVAVVALVAGGGALLLNVQSDGWFWKYAYQMHQGHDFYWDRIWPVTERKLFFFAPVVAVVCGLWLIVAATSWIRQRRLPAADRAQLYWLGVALTGVVVSAVGFATQWASANAYVPGLVFPAIFAAVAGADLQRRARALPGGALTAAALGLVVGGALAAQLALQLYRPGPHLPTPGDRRTGEELIVLLREIEGPVLMPYHPFYPVRAGKAPSYHQMGINDITRAGYPFPGDLRQRITQGYYSAVLLDNPPQGRYDFLTQRYKLGRYFPGSEVPRVVTGYPVRPTYLFVRKAPDPVPPGARRVFGFEEGTYDGWRLQGRAFGKQPAGGPVWGQGPVGPFEGSYLANSFHGGDRAQGTLLSPEFVVDRPWLSFLIGGGNRPGLEVRLLVDGRAVRRVHGPGGDILVRRWVDVSAYQGQTMQLELVDQESGPWGHLLFDDLVLEAAPPRASSRRE